MESILIYMQDPSLWENITTPFVECHVNNTTFIECNNSIILTEINSLLNHQNYNNAKQALLLVNSIFSINKINNQQILSMISESCLNFVYFPPLLEEYINILNKFDESIDIHNLSNMFCICIESHDSFSLDSTKILINYKGEKSLEIKLLPGLKNINHYLYDYVKKYKIRDTHYDNASINNLYIHGDIISQKRSHFNINYRDVYHLLIYGTINDLQSLIVYWDILGFTNCNDVTTKAACDFFNLPYNSPIITIKEMINQKCLI